MSANVFIFILFANRNVEKEFRVQIASAVGGRRGEGAYRKPLLRISRYSASEMDIFTEMDIFRKCKVFSGVKYKKFLGVFHLLPKDLEREYFDQCAGFCSGNWELGCQKGFLGCCFVVS